MNKTRREFLYKVGKGALAVPLAGIIYPGTAQAAEKIDPESDAAKALGYVHAAPNPSKNCGQCQLYKGSGSAKWGRCQIFPGQLVNARGWCSAWSA